MPRVRICTVTLVLLGVVLGLTGLSLADDAAKPAYRAYPLKHSQAEDAAATLLEMLSEHRENMDLVADSKSNRLLISAPDDVLQLAAKILKKLDLPPVPAKPVTVEPLVNAYSCPSDRIPDVVSTLREKFPPKTGVKIVGDAPGERVLIMATPAVHAELQKSLPEFGLSVEPVEASSSPAEQVTAAQGGRPQAPVRKSPKPIANPQWKQTAHEKTAAGKRSTPGKDDIQPVVHEVLDDAGSNEQFVPLEHLSVDAFLTNCKTLFRSRFTPAGPGNKQYRLTDEGGAELDLLIDAQRRGVVLNGDARLREQASRVLQGLVVPQGPTGINTRVMPLEGIPRETIQNMQQALKLDAKNSPQKPATPKKTSDSLNDIDGDRNEPGPSAKSLSTILLAANQEVAPATEAVAEPDANAEDLARQIDQPRRRLGADIDVEVMPDLDVIILRGNKADVQEMTRILNELERLSIETEPKIEVYPLQHVRGESLSNLIEKVLTDLTGGLRGKVSVTPLVKPNSLLIIGWGEAVTSVRQLIITLDKPVTPGTQFQVFRLKHADVQGARTAVQDFFTSRSGSGAATGSNTANVGLTPRVQVTADVRTNSLIVQAAPRELLEAAELIEQLDVPASEVVHQARVFRLKNTLATDMATVLQTAIDAARGKEGTSTANATQKSALLEFMSIDSEGHQVLKSGILSDLKITPEPRTNSLIVSAPAESMELIAALIQRMDESTRDGAQIKVFRVINGDATALVQMLRSLLPPPTAQQGSLQLASSRDESALVPARFSVDLRTNSIIATGSTGDLRIVEALLLRLDQRDIDQRKNMVYRLKNAPAPAVAKSINDFLRSERNVQQAAPGSVSPFQQIESEVVVVPEPVGNSLIISATPRFFDDIEKLVEKLDAQPPQVMIQVLIAQVSLNNLNEFGVELGLQDSLLFDRSLLGNLVTTTSTSQTSTPAGIVTSTATNILGATNAPGFNWNGAPLGNSGSTQSLATAHDIAGQAVSNFGVNNINSQLGYGGLVLSASSESVSVLIRALQQSSHLEVLSRPQIRTLDNQPAFIQIGQRVPRVSQAQINQIGSVNGITLENVGLILGVTPRISPEGMVVMEVDAEKSEVDQVDPGIPISISNSGQVIRSPIFNITTASTTVSAHSGETIIIGGLITKSTNDVHRRVPYLSDIPVLGHLFRYDSITDQRSELLIILTPYVIRGPEESARIKREEVAKMHWCAGDVFDIYGPGVIDDNCLPLTEGEVPVIYPDVNPRGSLEVPDDLPVPPAPPAPTPSLPPEPAEDLRGQNPKPSKSGVGKSKSFALFPKRSTKKP